MSISSSGRIRPVKFLVILSIAIEALWSNKLRTALTMLGVIIGISAVIAITSVGQGVQKGVGQQLETLGTNIVYIFSGAAQKGGVTQQAGSVSTLTWEDAKAIASQAPSARVVSTFLRQPARVVFGKQNISTDIYGTDANYPAAKDNDVQLGKYFTSEDVDAAKQVVILGSAVRDKLFGEDANPLGESIRIQGERYQVIGVMQPLGSLGVVDLDDRVYIPLTTMSARLAGNNSLSGISVSSILIRASDRKELEAVEFQSTNLLRLRHNIYPPQEDDFKISKQTDLIETFTNIMDLLTFMVIAIAGISLLVGGIGIANIMLVSVIERTREIGIRKALGATRSAILNQFLMEAIAISTAGGIIGTGLGIAIAALATAIFKFPFVVSIWSIIVGFGLSFSVGLVAGAIPAQNAAKLDPIIALRSD
jgi:putative ABC transport system permease protein